MGDKSDKAFVSTINNDDGNDHTLVIVVVAFRGIVDKDRQHNNKDFGFYQQGVSNRGFLGY